MSTPHKLLQLQPGAAVLYRDRLHRITHIIDLNEVLVEDDETRQVSHVKVGDLAPVVVAPSGGARPDLVSAPDEAWEEATKRFEIIRPLLDMPYRSRQDVVARAKEFERHEIHSMTGFDVMRLPGWLRHYFPVVEATKAPPNYRPKLKLSFRPWLKATI